MIRSNLEIFRQRFEAVRRLLQELQSIEQSYGSYLAMNMVAPGTSAIVGIVGAWRVAMIVFQASGAQVAGLAMSPTLFQRHRFEYFAMVSYMDVVA